ncbi:SCO6880 family protein [Streptoalloteichus hindustanus]|uniref:PrgI family protein n=1 Tax=Streptoalloteichus hindustanus TaxID=2017 RepID=A0A1M5MAD0_STRHI|nr:SCO6880 family protein [Streptoalloteichus hindustanus]SHG73643.1 hypothetical protein SAMN05444320_11332 [Streptoalloteichus hindustanus]
MSPRVYTGLSRREHGEWLMGLTLGQTVSCLLLAIPVVTSLAAGNWQHSMLLLGICGAAAGLVVVPFRGRPAARWMLHWATHRVGALTGWSAWQSHIAAGEVLPPQEPDLPGALSRLSFVDGPTYKDHGRLCLVHDTADHQWTVVARLTHQGVGLASDDERETLAVRLGALLRGLAHHDTITRLSVYVRTAPDDGAAYETWRATHHRPDAPDLAVAVTDELRRTLAERGIRHEMFLAVSAPETALRGPAAAAGGGPDGRAHTLYRALDGVEDQLRGMGCTHVEWLDSPGLAAAVRSGFNPHATGEHPCWAAAGPTAAPPPAARSYTHDGFTSVTYAALPESGVLFGSLGSLVIPRTVGERRALAVHYEILPPHLARRAVRVERQRHALIRDIKTRRGFAVSAADQRAVREAYGDENAVAAGHAIVRYAAVVSVTVPADWEVEDHAARLENTATGRIRLLRLELAQDNAFVAACVPVGLGLPKLRWTRIRRAR